MLSPRHQLALAYGRATPAHPGKWRVVDALAGTAAPPAPSDGASAAQTLADAMSGIRMPAELAPLMGDTPDPRHMLFATFGATPLQVGTGLADELERLGYEITPVDERTITATRADAEIDVRILPDRDAAQAALGTTSMTVPEDAVVAEFRLS